jgi:acetylornithine deacetylase/succinyl-diaminopimelate desuccinylase-like protein
VRGARREARGAGRGAGRVGPEVLKVRWSLGLMLGVTLAAQTPDLRQIVRADVAQHQQAIVDELLQLLAIPNVAADKPNIRRNAEHLQRLLTRHGLASEILETGGNPLVYASADFGKPATILFYCHYDGQPVDPKKWLQADPFEPVVKGEGADARIFARSASDDKAPIVALLAALDALKRAGLEPTANIRLILDGEEEASSPSLVPAIGRYREKLRADLMVILDGPGHSSGRPTVAFGARGIATIDLTVFGPKSGVHSGNYGNWIPNPAQRLASLLASMKDDSGRVTIAGYYDGVAPLTADERAMLDAVPDDSARMLGAFGVAAPEAAFPKLQDALQAPTLNVRGLTSAFVGDGARTIVPDRATAAIDIRLVKETPAADLLAKLRAHVVKQGYRLVDADPDEAARATYGKLARIAAKGTTTSAFRTATSDPRARAVIASLTRTYGQPPVQLRTLGGTVPIAPFIEALGFPAIVVPTVNFDNNQHEENENLRLATFFDSIVTIASVMRQ